MRRAEGWREDLVSEHAVAGRLPALDDAYAAHMRAICRPDTDVQFFSLPERYVRFAAVESLFAQYFALRAERRGSGHNPFRAASDALCRQESLDSLAEGVSRGFFARFGEGRNPENP